MYGTNMPKKLTTIADLQNDGWQPILQEVASVGDLFESWKSKDTGFNRTVPVEFGDDTKRSPGLHASELNSCLRQAHYAVMGQERRLPPGDERTTNMKMRFQIGTAVHALIQDDLMRIGDETMSRTDNGLRFIFEPEVRIEPSLGGVAERFGYSSSCDGVFTFYSNQDEIILRMGLEIKTMSDKEFKKHNTPVDYHVQQATLYQKALDLPLMWYLYYNKSDSHWSRPKAPFIQAYSEAEWRKLEARSIEVVSSCDSGIPPEREEGFHCRWCPFTYVCKPPSLNRFSQGPAKPRRIVRA